MERVLIAGAGAVGATFLAKLHAQNPGLVAVLAHGERRGRLERDGVTVNGVRIVPRCVSPGERHAADLVLVAVKHHHLERLIVELSGFVAEETIIVSLLNGISSEGLLARAFGEAHVLPAFVIGNDVVREGQDVRYTSMGRLVVGAPSNDRDDSRVVAVKQLLERADLTVEVPDDILRAQWFKFMINVAVNQVSAVLRAGYGAFSSVPEVRELARRAALEAVAIARAEGVALTTDDADAFFAILARLSPDGKTSMLQDVEAQRKTEVELFADTIVELGRRHGVATPVNELLGLELHAIERLSAVRTPVR